MGLHLTAMWGQRRCLQQWTWGQGVALSHLLRGMPSGSAQGQKLLNLMHGRTYPPFSAAGCSYEMDDIFPYNAGGGGKGLAVVWLWPRRTPQLLLRSHPHTGLVDCSYLFLPFFLSSPRQASC